MDSFCESMDSYWFEGHKSRLKKIRFLSSVTNPDFKRFGLYHDHKSSQFSKDSTCFHESNESSQILSTKAPNQSLKIKICKSWFLMNPGWWTRKSRFAIPDPKDLNHGFVLEKQFPKLLDSFWFGRICILLAKIYINQTLFVFIFCSNYI